MFSIFKKKSYPSQDTWTLATGTLNKKSMTVRRNDYASSLVGHADYMYRVTETVAMIDPQPNGLPTEAEPAYLEEIEIAVAECLEAGQDCLQILAVTTDGFRDVIFHSRAPKKVEASLEEIRRRFPYRRITLSIEADRKWRVFKEFTHYRLGTPPLVQRIAHSKKFDDAAP